MRPGQAIEDREQTLQEPNFGLLTEAGVDLDLIYLGKDLRRKSGYYWYVKHSDGQLVGKAWLISLKTSREKVHREKTVCA